MEYTYVKRIHDKTKQHKEEKGKEILQVYDKKKDQRVWSVQKWIWTISYKAEHAW